MTKKLTTKEKLQTEYKNLFGTDADKKLTIADLESALQSKQDIGQETEPTENVAVSAQLPETDSASAKATAGVSAKADEGKNKSKSPKKIWTNDRSELVKIEGTKESVRIKDDKGNVKGGRQYYGVKK